MNAQKSSQIQLPLGQEEIKVEVHVRFGNPQFDDCRNFGICKISERQLPNVMTRQRKQCSNAMIVFEKKSLKIYFDKSSMSEETKSVFFGKKHFVMEVEKLIPNAISKKINQTDLLIPKGKYKIKEKRDYFFIAVRL